MTPPTTNTHDPVAAELAALRAEYDEITDAIDTDPARAAEDVAAWHGRELRRSERKAQIEARRRDLETWGALALTHSDAITRYQSVSGPVTRRFSRLVKTRTWAADATGLGQHRDISTAARAVRDWWNALSQFARALDLDDEQARRVLTRETDAWVNLRNAMLQAEATWAGYTVPIPEAGIDGELPGWIRIGAHRTDR